MISLEQSESNGCSRREVLKSAASMVAIAVAPAVLGAPSKAFDRSKEASTSAASESASKLTAIPYARRYMAAASPLPDGKIFVTGGYSRPWNGMGRPPTPSSAAIIFDASSGQCWAAEPMHMGRARHAAVALTDGRVAVIGGMAHSALASVEVYDPRTNLWSISAPLKMGRYDHCAIADGFQITVLGGSGISMSSSVEVLTVSATGATP